MSPPELGHNREISRRNDFFIMSVGGNNIPPPQMNGQLIEDLMNDAAAMAAPQPNPDPIDELNRFVYNSDDDSRSSEESIEDPALFSEEQIRTIIRNATIVLIRNMEAHIRFHRVDVHRVEDLIGENATTAAMRYRLEAMEEMLEAFEHNNLFNGYIPRQLFQE